MSRCLGGRLGTSFFLTVPEYKKIMEALAREKTVKLIDSIAEVCVHQIFRSRF